MKTTLGMKSLVLIAVASGMAGCDGERGPPDRGRAGAITPGIYDVCDPGDYSVHGDHKREHLDGKKVEIKRLFPAEATAVCIGADGCPADLADPQFAGTVLWMIGDEKLLRTVHPFEHEVDGQPGTAFTPHLVTVVADPTDKPPLDQCNKGNVLIVRICQPHPQPTETSQWECERAPHGSDAHIQN